MLILEDANRIIDNALRNHIKEYFQSCASRLVLFSRDNGSKERLDVKFDDFGETQCHLFEQPDNDDSLLFLSVTLPSYKELVKLGLKPYLENQLGQTISFHQQTEAGYDFTISVKKNDLTAESISKLSMIRRICLELPLNNAINSQLDGQSTALMSIPLHGNDVMYIQANVDRVTVVFATKFDDPSDITLGKIFLQEFYDARRQNNLQNAPMVLFGKEPPNEVKSLMTPPLPLVTDGSLNYITFVLFPTHYKGEKRQKCMSLILSFRDYFHYHIKCSKAFLHNRMRGKVSEFLKMLNRAKPLALNSKSFN